MGSKPTSISQARLATLLSLRDKQKAIQEQADEVAKRIAEMERGIMSMLVEGMEVQPGRYSAGLQTKMGPCTPKWKELYVNHMGALHGEPAAVTEEKARALYPAQPKTVLNVVDTKARP